jgi:hypothetical protein
LFDENIFEGFYIFFHEKKVSQASSTVHLPNGRSDWSRNLQRNLAPKLKISPETTVRLRKKGHVVYNPTYAISANNKYTTSTTNPN